MDNWNDEFTNRLEARGVAKEDITTINIFRFALNTAGIERHNLQMAVLKLLDEVNDLKEQEHRRTGELGQYVPVDYLDYGLNGEDMEIYEEVKG
ncbi:MAG: hypothetical protein HLX46_02630 [Corynebacterium sp.]|nr:hypothetical protein [Corynebacterium sp.]